MSKLSGVSIRATVQREVELVCPRCGVDRCGAIVDLQRWYHVGGVPVMPLARLEQMVECGVCGYRAGLGVLEIPTAAVLADRLEQAMRSAAATMVRAAYHDGSRSVDIDVIDEALTVVRSSGYDYDENVLQRDLASTNDIDTIGRLRLLADDLTPHGKQGLMHRMMSIALVDGVLSPSERRAVSRMGDALGMVRPHINGILGTASQQFQSAA